MEKKSIREMTEKEKARNSLNAKVLRTTLMGSLVLGLAALAVGLFMLTYTLIEQSVKTSYNVVNQAAWSLEMQEDPAYMTSKVLEIYESLTDEERQKTGTDEYRDHFRQLFGDLKFTTCIDTLDPFLSGDVVSDVYIGYVDRDRKALVYIFDPDLSEETGCYPGEWEPLNDREMAKLLNWNGEGILYDIGNTERYGYMCTTAVPFFDIHGNRVCFVMADVTLTGILNKMKAFVLRFTLALLPVIALFGLRLSRRMKERLVKPINEITETAQEYMEDRKQGIASRRFMHLNIETGDELEELSLMMADMEQAMADYEANLTIITADRERIVTELTLAEKIQAGVLPKTFPAFPDRHEFDIYAVMDPAREVGGDFYDYYLIDDDHLALTISDVSGKGIPGALFMMSAKIMIADYYRLGKSPADLLEAANNSFCESNKEEMFITVWTAVLEISTGKVVAANAGHEYPVLRHAGQNFEVLKDKHGFVIGGMEGMKYKEYEFTMEPGSTLFVYTDGVPEATAENGELFGMDRMVESLNSDPDASAQQILANVRASVDGFVGEAEQFDDLTMLCIKYFGPQKKEA
jgi:sigma-B regulation protein RsbU (phosphoserine phosphatase)